MTGANGEVSFINIKTLNEWDSRVRCTSVTLLGLHVCKACCLRLLSPVLLGGLLRFYLLSVPST